MRSCEVSGKWEIGKWSRYGRCERDKKGRLKKKKKKNRET
jgi:hypothetical protein